MAGTPGLQYEVDKGKDLVASYRIWLRDSELTAKKAVALSNDFVTPPEANVSHIADFD